MGPLLGVLLAWVASHSGYNGIVQEPGIELVTRAELGQLFRCQEKGKFQIGQTPLALYDRDSETIYLKDSFDIQNVEDQGQLVHELVHHFQNISGVYETKWKHVCGQPDEEEAYIIEAQFLLENSADSGVIKNVQIQGKLKGICQPRYIQVFPKDRSSSPEAFLCPGSKSRN